MKKLLAINFLIALLLCTACNKIVNSTEEYGTASNTPLPPPPPPPSKAFIDEMNKSVPPPDEVIKAARFYMKKDGYSEKEIEAAVSQFIAQLKRECQPCYDKVKNMQ